MENIIKNADLDFSKLADKFPTTTNSTTEPAAGTVQSAAFKALNNRFRTEDIYGSLLKVPATDLTVGHLLAELYGPCLTFIPTTKTGTSGEWYYWNGVIHQPAEYDVEEALTTGFALAYAEFVTATRAFIRNEKLGDDAEKALNKVLTNLSSYSVSIQSTRGLASLASRARKTFAKPVDHFDNDTEWIVLADGRVLLTADPLGTPMAADPSRPVSKCLALTLDENAGEPVRFLNTLNEWELPEDDQRYIQVALGAALTGRGDAKNIPTLVGRSHTGKSTFMRIMGGSDKHNGVFGGYAGFLPSGAIVDKGSSNFEQYVARGKRFIYLEEPYEKKTDDSFLKNLAGGGGPIPTQKKGENVVTWRAQGQLFIGANHVPRINTHDDAIVGRINIIEFNKVFAPGAAGTNVALDAELLEAEGPAILRWVLEGAAEYNRTNAIPKSSGINNSANNNVAESSVTISWLNEMIEDGKISIITDNEGDLVHRNMLPVSKELYAGFAQWCMENGIAERISRLAWAKEINSYMKAPSWATDPKCRPGGQRRFWRLETPSAAVHFSQRVNEVSPVEMRHGVATLAPVS